MDRDTRRPYANTEAGGQPNMCAAPTPLIRLLENADIGAVNAHFARHRAESGSGAAPFMPFELDDPDGPTGVTAADVRAPEQLTPAALTDRWRCWHIALSGPDAVVGHVDLFGAELRAGAHRCELGIGIERAWRGAGLGRRLLFTAIDFVRARDALHWLDLRVFAHNEPARALYRSAGFVEIGVVRDCFRVGGRSVDDVLMTLYVGPPDGASTKR